MTRTLLSSLSVAAAVFGLFLLAGCGEEPTSPTYRVRFDATSPRAEMAPEGKELFVKKKCANCHLTKGNIKTVGPNLSGIGARMEARDLEIWVRDPRRQKPTGIMPPFDGTEDQLEAIVAYLMSLR